MPIELNCSRCYRITSVRDELAGKHVKCPECGAALPVPEADGRARIMGFPDLLDSAPEPERENRPLPASFRKPANKTGPVLLLFAGLAALALVAVGIWFMLRPKPGSDVQRWVPGTAQGFATINIKTFYDSPSARAVDALIRKAQPGQAGMFDPGVLPHQEGDRFTFVVMDGEAMSFWMVLESSRPLSQDASFAKFQGTTHKTFEGRKYTVGMMPGQLVNFASHSPNDRLMVVGTETGVVEAMKLAYAADRTTGPLDESLAMLKSKRLLASAFHPDAKAAAGMGVGADGKLAPLAAFTSLTVQVDLDQDLTGEAVLTYSSPDAASKAKATEAEAKEALQGAMLLVQFLGNVPAESMGFLNRLAASPETRLDGSRLIIKFKADKAPEAIRALAPLMKQLN